MRFPLVSIIIPVFNQAEFLGDAIRSIKTASNYEVEVIVINDGSDEQNRALIQKNLHEHPRTLLLRHPHGKNLGVSASRLLGLKYAKGDYVAFLDADDEFAEGKLAAQVEFLEREESYGFVHTAINVIGGSSELGLEVQRYFNSFVMEEDYKRIHRQNKICFSSSMVRTGILRNLMFSLPYHHQYEDWALWNVLLEAHKGHFLSEPLTNYRVHDKSASENIRKSRGLELGSLIEFYLSLTVVFRNPILKLCALSQLVHVLWQRRREMIFGLRNLEEYRVEGSYPNLLAVSLLEMKSKNLVVWGYGSLGRRLITSLHCDGVRIGIVVDKRFDGVAAEADVLYLSPTAFLQLADSKKQFLIVATSLYKEVVSQIKRHERFSLDSVVVTDPACDCLQRVRDE